MSPFLRDTLAVTLSAMAVFLLGLVYLFPPVIA